MQLRRSRDSFCELRSPLIRVRFLAGPVMPAGSPTVRVAATIPPGTQLIVPIITVECSVAEEPPFHGEDEAELRTCANGLLDLASDPQATIDGTPVNDPGAYRVQSRVFRYGPLPEGNVLGLPPGTKSGAVAAGDVLVLPSLSPGVHRITVRANVADFGIAVDTEFVITVAPRKS